MNGVGGNSLAIENKVPADVLGMRTHARALVGLGQSPASTIAQRGNGGFSNFRE
jgi:hypothetical protein